MHLTVDLEGHGSCSLEFEGDPALAPLKRQVRQEFCRMLPEALQFDLRLPMTDTLLDDDGVAGLCDGDLLQIIPDARHVAVARLREDSVPVTHISLAAAIRNDNEQRARLLIDAGVEPLPSDIPTCETDSMCRAIASTLPRDVLSAALAQALREVPVIVATLLDMGADPNTPFVRRRVTLLPPPSVPPAIVPALLRAGWRPEFHPEQLALATEGCTAETAAERVAALLRAGISPDVCGGGHDALLPTAAGRGQLAVCAVLLQSGAAVEATSCGMTALSHAAAEGDMPLAALCMRYGADVSVRCGAGQTCLMKAAHGGHAAMCSALVDAGADVHADPDGNGDTCLVHAIVGGNIDVVRLFVSRGARPTDALRTRCFRAASAAGLLEACELCGPAAELPPAVLRDAAESAAEEGHAAVLRHILETCVGALGADGTASLELAVRGGHTACCLLLLAGGAEVPSAALLAAVRHRQAGVAELCALLLRHVPTGQQHPSAPAALEAAVDEAVRCGVGQEQLQVVELLLQHGAPPGGSGGVPPIVRAAEGGNVGLCALLLQHGAGVPDGCLRAAACCGSLDVCRLLLQHGACARVPPGHESPLHVAAHRADAAMCRLLLEGGAQHDARDAKGRTPLLACAVSCPRSAGGGVRNFFSVVGDAVPGVPPAVAEVCGVLLDAGAAVDAEDVSGWTALVYAAHNGVTELCRLLLQRGAKVTHVTHDDWTPSTVAASNFYDLTRQVLLDVNAVP